MVCPTVSRDWSRVRWILLWQHGGLHSYTGWVLWPRYGFLKVSCHPSRGWSVQWAPYPCRVLFPSILREKLNFDWEYWCRGVHLNKKILFELILLYISSQFFAFFTSEYNSIQIQRSFANVHQESSQIANRIGINSIFLINLYTSHYPPAHCILEIPLWVAMYCLMR